MSKTIANENGEATIYLYDVIGGWFGVPTEDLVKEIAQLKAGTIHLRINSPGGEIFAARSIETALRQQSANVIAHIDGMAASAASFIAMAANEIEMSDGAFLMIHRSMTMIRGNAPELLDAAALLEKVDESINSTFQRRTNQSAEQIKEWMDAETWFTSAEALENGFVDRIFEGEKPENAFDLRLFDYKNVPEPLLTKAVSDKPIEPEQEVIDDVELEPVEEPFDHSENDRTLQLIALA